MRLRPTGDETPFRTTHSELFEAAFLKLEGNFPFIAEAYDLLDWLMARDPWGESLPVDAFSERRMRLVLTAATRRFPSLRVLAEIEEERRLVTFWHLGLRE